MITVAIMSSTIAGNSAVARGGGISGAFSGGEVTITSSTISGNSSAETGGGIHGYPVMLAFSNISGNSADVTGGGIYAGPMGEISLRNSIVAANSAIVDGFDMAAGRLTAAYSLIGDNTGLGLSEAPVGMPDENGNFVGDPTGSGIIDPLLSPLGNFGGRTKTQALLPGSAAINAGDPDFVAPPDHDQRGAPFVRVSGGRVDMGAFESQIPPVDFNKDGRLDCSDVDPLVAAIVGGENPPEFDLTNDDIVDEADLNVWLALAGLENLASHEAYPLGDANLDGRVNTTDLNVIGLNWRQDVTGWCSGDLTADGIVDAGDLNRLGVSWLQDATDEVATHARVPRAPLANRMAVVAQAPLVFVTEPEFWSGNVKVESRTELAVARTSFKSWPKSPPQARASSPADAAADTVTADASAFDSAVDMPAASRFAKRYLRGELRSSRINFRAGDFHQSQDKIHERVLDLVLERW